MKVGGYRRYHRPEVVATPRQKCFNVLFFAMFLIFALYVFVGSDYGLYQIWHQSKRLRTLDREIEELKQQNQMLARQVHLLQNDLRYIEKVAREQYGMQKKGETVYRIIDERVLGGSLRDGNYRKK